MDGPRDHYTKWNKSRQVNIIWYNLYVESKKTEHIYKTETES